MFPGYLNTKEQGEWSRRCISEYSKAQYTNLTLLNEKNDTLWDDTCSTEPMNFKKFRRLTWSNVGVNYNWTDREYKLKETDPFPKEMKILGKEIGEKILNFTVEPQ
eukprot:UN25902